MKTPLHIAASLLLILAIGSAQAETLVSYNFTGAPGTQVSQSPAFVLPGLSASHLFRDDGLTPSGATGSISSSGFPTGGIILVDDYYELTITPQIGSAVDYDSILFGERRSGTGIRDFSIRTSLDGFASDLFTLNVPDDTITRFQTVNFTNAFSAVSDPLTIRFYGFNAESNLGTWRLTNHSLGEMQITGTVTVVPEPSTFVAMLALPTVALAAIRRCRRHRVQS